MTADTTPICIGCRKPLTAGHAVSLCLAAYRELERPYVPYDAAADIPEPKRERRGGIIKAE